MNSNKKTFADVLHDCLHKIEGIEKDSECRVIILNELNEYFRSKTSKSFSLDDNIKKCALDMLDSKNQDILEFINENPYDDNEYSTINAEEYLDDLKKRIGAISNSFDEDLLERYLKSYAECTEKVILNYQHQFDPCFRQCRLVKNLYSVGTIPSEKLADKELMYLSLYSPYTIDAIIMIIEHIIKYRKELTSDDNLKEMKYDLFVKQELKKFKRSALKTSSEYDVRNIFYDKKSDEIVSFPTNYLSSVEAVNPIILVDKIKNYIKSEMENNNAIFNNKYIDINVLTIGSVNRDNELNNVVDIIINWYNRNYNKPKLNLNITSLISNKDIFEDKANINKELNGNKGCAKSIEIDYHKIYFNIGVLKEYILKSDISFVLDCPFMTIESLKVYQQGSLGMFARRFPRAKIVSLLNDYYKELIDSNESLHCDKIVRILRDVMLRYMVYLIKTSDSKKLKELYVSVDDSYYEFGSSFDEVLNKEEMNDTSKITFSKYTNKAEKMLEYDVSNQINFNISVWSLLKHISIDYLFNHLAHLLNNTLGNCLEYEKTFAIFDSICLTFKVNHNYVNNSVDISLGFLESFDSIIVNELGFNKDMLDSIKSSINNSLLQIFKPLFENIIFNNYDNYSNPNIVKVKFHAEEADVIKKAFYHAAYNSAKKVNDMLFVHNYSLSLENKKGKYSARLNDKYNKKPITNDSVCNDTFNEKRNYELVMRCCELSNDDSLDIGLLALLNRSNRVFKTPAMAGHALKNIEDLYKNCYGHNNYDDYDNHYMAKRARCLYKNLK